jgi:hypothetical protein
VIPEELWPDAEAEQAKRMQDDPWESELQSLIVGGRPHIDGVVDGTQTDGMSEPEWRVSTGDLLGCVLGIPAEGRRPKG